MLDHAEAGRQFARRLAEAVCKAKSYANRTVCVRAPPIFVRSGRFDFRFEMDADETLVGPLEANAERGCPR